MQQYHSLIVKTFLNRGGVELLQSMLAVAQPSAPRGHGDEEDDRDGSFHVKSTRNFGSLLGF